MVVRFMVVAIALLLCLSTAQALVVKVPEVSASAGESVDVAVIVEGANELGSMDLVITFDPEIVEVMSVGKGELNRGLLSSHTTDGKLAISLADSKGISGDGEIAVITFKALKEGTTELKIESVRAYNVNTHTDIAVDATNGKLTVSKPNATPGFEVAGAVAAITALLIRRRL